MTAIAMHLSASDRRAIAREQIAVLNSERKSLVRRMPVFCPTMKDTAEFRIQEIDREVTRFQKWGA